MPKCGCGQLLCACSIKGKSPLTVTGNGTPDHPYEISLEHDGKKDCQAITECVGENLTDLLGYDKTTGKIGITYKGAHGCDAIADCVGEHATDGLVYDKTTRHLKVVTNCDETMACVSGRLSQLIDSTDPGGNALQIHGGKLLVKPAESGSPWDCNQTVTCMAARLGPGLQTAGTGDAQKFEVKTVPGIAPSGGGITVTDQGVRLDPAFQHQIRGAWAQAQRNQPLALKMEREPASHQVVAMNLPVSMSGARLDAGVLVLEEPGIWTVHASVDYAFTALPPAGKHNMIYWEVEGPVGDGTYGGVDAVAPTRRYGSAKSGIVIVQPGKPVACRVMAWRANDSATANIVTAEIGAAKV